MKAREVGQQGGGRVDRLDKGPGEEIEDDRRYRWFGSRGWGEDEWGSREELGRKVESKGGALGRLRPGSIEGLDHGRWGWS